MEYLTVLTWIMTLSSALMAGTYLAFSMVIMRSLATLGTAKGVEAMNAINRTILKTAFMPLFFGSTIISALMVIAGLWHWGEPGANRAIGGGLVYFIGMFVVTAAGNVPLNNRLDEVEGDGTEAHNMWTLYLSRWTRWNTVRTMACTLTVIICIDLLTM